MIALLDRFLKATLLSVCLIFSGKLDAKDPWTKEDKIRQGIYYIATTIDMFQTIEFRADGHEEANPILGKTPSKATVISVCLGTMLVHTMVADLLPAKYRKLFQEVSIGLEVAAISWNHIHAGVRIRW